MLDALMYLASGPNGPKVRSEVLWASPIRLTGR
jgi:hypothetical protein